MVMGLVLTVTVGRSYCKPHNIITKLNISFAKLDNVITSPYNSVRKPHNLTAKFFIKPHKVNLKPHNVLFKPRKQVLVNHAKLNFHNEYFAWKDCS